VALGARRGIVPAPGKRRMATIHDLVAYGKSGLRGMQTSQRDWSPFVAHFTTYSAMAGLRTAIRAGRTPAEIEKLLDEADAVSAETSAKIAASKKLLASSPSKKDDVPRCVCFSECSLPGLLGHCERYGRFGWVFRKTDIYGLGGRPCFYVSSDEYAEVAKRGRGESVDTPAGRLFGLANVYTPPKQGRVQDYTHEREWRLFGDLDLGTAPPELILAPSRFIADLRRTFGDAPHYIPLDLLHEWGL